MNKISGKINLVIANCCFHIKYKVKIGNTTNPIFLERYTSYSIPKNEGIFAISPPTKAATTIKRISFLLPQNTDSSL